MKRAESSRQKAEQLGRTAEVRAAVMLRLKGWRILAQRWKCKVGEVDLIVRRGNVVAFVEVKARADAASALGSVGAHQRRRIVATARQWLAENPAAEQCDCRFDIVLITPYQWPQHLANAYGADDQ